MGVVGRRDTAVVVEGFARWLAARRDAAVAVDAVDRPTDGWSGETLLVRVRLDGAAEGFALRLAPVGEGIFPDHDLTTQAWAQGAAAAHGVPTAVPVEVVDDDAWLGEPFLVMPLVEGHVPGEVAGLDPWVQALPTDARRGLSTQVADLLADLHIPAPDPTLDLPHRHVDTELAWWGDYLDWATTAEEAGPTLRTALARLGEGAPAEEPRPSLLWGDVRLGNVVYAEDTTVAAALDWEMATVGAPEHDLAWWWALEALAHSLLGGRPPGFPTHAELRARYEARVGRALVDLGWYECFALVRSAAVLTRIAVLQQRAGLAPKLDPRSNPVLDHLARRLDEELN